MIVGLRLDPFCITLIFSLAPPPPGKWRGAGDRVDGLRTCKNTATSWLEACVGGDVVGEVFILFFGPMIEVHIQKEQQKVIFPPQTLTQ